jgi:hypothetical protein
MLLPVGHQWPSEMNSAIVLGGRVRECFDAWTAPIKWSGLGIPRRLCALTCSYHTKKMWHMFARWWSQQIHKISIEGPLYVFVLVKFRHIDLTTAELIRGMHVIIHFRLYFFFSSPEESRLLSVSKNKSSKRPAWSRYHCFVGWLSTDYMVLHSRRYVSWYFLYSFESDSIHARCSFRTCIAVVCPIVTCLSVPFWYVPAISPVHFFIHSHAILYAQLMS